VQLGRPLNQDEIRRIAKSHSVDPRKATSSEVVQKQRLVDALAEHAVVVNK